MANTNTQNHFSKFEDLLNKRNLNPVLKTIRKQIKLDGKFDWLIDSPIGGNYFTTAINKIANAIQGINRVSESAKGKLDKEFENGIFSVVLDNISKEDIKKLLLEEDITKSIGLSINHSINSILLLGNNKDVKKLFSLIDWNDKKVLNSPTVQSWLTNTAADNVLTFNNYDDTPIISLAIETMKEQKYPTEKIKELYDNLLVSFIFGISDPKVKGKLGYRVYMRPIQNAGDFIATWAASEYSDISKIDFKKITNQIKTRYNIEQLEIDDEFINKAILSNKDYFSVKDYNRRAPIVNKFHTDNILTINNIIDKLISDKIIADDKISIKYSDINGYIGRDYIAEKEPYLLVAFQKWNEHKLKQSKQLMEKFRTGMEKEIGTIVGRNISLEKYKEVVMNSLEQMAVVNISALKNEDKFLQEVNKYLDKNKGIVINSDKSYLPHTTSISDIEQLINKTLNQIYSVDYYFDVAHVTEMEKFLAACSITEGTWGKITSELKALGKVVPSLDNNGTNRSADREDFNVKMIEKAKTNGFIGNYINNFSEINKKIKYIDKTKNIEEQIALSHDSRGLIYKTFGDLKTFKEALKKDDAVPYMVDPDINGLRNIESNENALNRIKDIFVKYGLLFEAMNVEKANVIETKYINHLLRSSLNAIGRNISLFGSKDNYSLPKEVLDFYKNPAVFNVYKEVVNMSKIGDYSNPSIAFINILEKLIDEGVKNNNTKTNKKANI